MRCFVGKRLGSHSLQLQRAHASAAYTPVWRRAGARVWRAAAATAAAVGGMALIRDVETLETTSGLGIHCVPNEANVALLKSIDALKRPYVRFPAVAGDEGHLETLAGAMLRERPAPKLKRELLRAPDGGTVALDWHEPEYSQLDASAPVLILIPGLTGGSDAQYIRHAVVGASKRGMRVVVYNHCGVCNAPVTSPRLYSACYTEDLRLSIKHISRCYPQAPLVSAAFSIGANILVHYLQEEAEAERRNPGSPRPLLTAAVSLCNPFDLVLGDNNWRRPEAGFRRTYDLYLAARMREVFRQNWDVLTSGASTGVSPDNLSVPQPGGSARPPQLPVSDRDQEALTAASGIPKEDFLPSNSDPVSESRQSSSSSSSSSDPDRPGSCDSSLQCIPAPRSSRDATGESSAVNGGGPAASSHEPSGSAKGRERWPARVPKPLFPQTSALIQPEGALNAATVRDFDEAATRHWFGPFSSVDEYYTAASSGPFLHAVSIPTLCINAMDDPICPNQAIPMDAFKENPNLLLITTPTGGHLGWVDLSPEGGSWRGPPWTERVMLDFLGGVLAQHKNGSV